MAHDVKLCLSVYKGRLAQLARALALQARCHRFESYIAHFVSQKLYLLVCEWAGNYGKRSNIEHTNHARISRQIETKAKKRHYLFRFYLLNIPLVKHLIAYLFFASYL